MGGRLCEQRSPSRGSADLVMVPIQQCEMIISERIRERVRAAYSAAAADPQGKHPFPVGRSFAESLGYPVGLLCKLPAVAVDSFTGVSNVAIFAEIHEGDVVLDLGCGAGLDSLIASDRVGGSGKVVGIDFSEPMLSRARAAATELGVQNVKFYNGSAERLPLRDGCVDVTLVNGIFNLNPQRRAIFQELARVIRLGGRVYAAERVLNEPLAPGTRLTEDDWFA